MTDTRSGDVAVDPVVIPASLDAADASDFIAMVEVRNAALRESTGRDDLEYSAAELLPGWQSDEDEEGHAWLARIDGVPVARFVLEFPMEDDSDVAYFDLDVLQESARPQVVEAGLATVEAATRAKGRHILQSDTLHRPADGEREPARSGFGAVPRDARAIAMLEHGFSLEQVDRNSVLDLHGDWASVERLHEDAATAAGAAYRVVAWTLPTPDEHVDDYAWMMSRMSTDAPAADLVWDEEKWDATRLRRYEGEILDGGRFGSVVAAQHVESGRLVAFNELFVNEDRTGVTEQNATLVLREHRGHRLGLLVKAANLLRWRELAPGSPRVTTFNAEENRHMLAINEALGFVPVAYAGGWKKVLDA